MMQYVRWMSIGILGTILSLSRLATAMAPPTVTLQVQVRTVAGQPLAGVTLVCAPQPGALGGPRLLPPPASQTTTTAVDGRARCTGLAAGMWRVWLTGTVAGVPVQPVAAQGQPPYGRARDGGGFPVALDPTGGTDEGAALLTPLPGPVVGDLALVGQVRAGVWVPELDRQTGDGPPTPQSLFPLAGEVPTLAVAGTVPPGATPPHAAPAVTPVPVLAAAAGPPPPRSPNTGWSPSGWLVFWIPVGMAGAGMLARWAWLQWRDSDPQEKE